MQLVGMLDSPYVRRVAIALMRLGLPFEHRPISLFRHIDEFSAVNPLLKAPTLVADDGTVLMDSTLIIDYAATLAPDVRPLAPRAPKARLRATRLIGLSLVVCEKAVQFHYERELPGWRACGANCSPRSTRWSSRSTAARGGCSRIV